MKILKKRSIIPIFLFVIACFTFITFQITFLFVNNMWENRVEQMIDTDKTTLSEAVSYVDEVVKGKSVIKSSSENLLDGTLSGYLSGTQDRFAMYMNDAQYKDYLALVNAQEYSPSGIGISVLYDSTVDGLYVVNVYSDSPAEKSGIVPGDIITEINYAPVSEYGFYGAMLEISSGQTKSDIRLGVRHKDSSVSYMTIVRDIVTSVSISGKKYDRKNGIIRINEFSNTAFEDFKKVLSDLVVSGAEKIIIDVRNNPGGSIEQISKILDFMLPEGVIISATSKDGRVTTIMSDVNELSIPMAVLVNKNTVAGAEIFAGTLSEGGKAKVLGENTYGKATTQEIFSIMPKGVISFSTMMYSLPSGKSFDGIGIVPDIRVVQTCTQYPIPKDLDSVLQKAIKVLEDEEFENQGV